MTPSLHRDLQAAFSRPARRVAGALTLSFALLNSAAMAATTPSGQHKADGSLSSAPDIPLLSNPDPVREAPRRACTPQYGSVALYGCRPKTHAVMDIETGTMVLGKDAHRRIQPASVTKTMTKILAFDAMRAGQLTPDQPIVFSQRAYPRDKITMGWINSGSRPGDRIRVDTVLRLMSTRSVNDGAVAVAEAIAGTEAAFAEQMNRKAREIGMKNTRFVNASGWEHKDQYSTAHDLALMMRYAVQNYPDYLDYLGVRTASYKGQTFPSHNNMLAGMQRGALRGFDEVLHGKTGFFNNAGFQVVLHLDVAGRAYAVVTTGHHSSATRHQHVRNLITTLRPHAQALAGSSHPSSP
jgi:D-alanyl-D-alanine carboxypeptidase